MNSIEQLGRIFSIADAPRPKSPVQCEWRVEQIVQLGQTFGGAVIDLTEVLEAAGFELPDGTHVHLRIDAHAEQAIKVTAAVTERFDAA